jgi:hypothetical protein
MDKQPQQQLQHQQEQSQRDPSPPAVIFLLSRARCPSHSSVCPVAARSDISVCHITARSYASCGCQRILTYRSLLCATRRWKWWGVLISCCRCSCPQDVDFIIVEIGKGSLAKRSIQHACLFFVCLCVCEQIDNDR